MAILVPLSLHCWLCCCYFAIAVGWLFFTKMLMLPSWLRLWSSPFALTISIEDCVNMLVIFAALWCCRHLVVLLPWPLLQLTVLRNSRLVPVGHCKSNGNLQWTGITYCFLFVIAADPIDDGTSLCQAFATVWLLSYLSALLLPAFAVVTEAKNASIWKRLLAAAVTANACCAVFAVLLLLDTAVGTYRWLVASIKMNLLHCHQLLLAAMAITIAAVACTSSCKKNRCLLFFSLPVEMTYHSDRRVSASILADLHLLICRQCSSQWQCCAKCRHTWICCWVVAATAAAATTTKAQIDIISIFIVLLRV